MDDTNLAMDKLEAGCRLVDVVVVVEEVEGDRAMPRDRKTAKLSYIWDISEFQKFESN